MVVTNQDTLLPNDMDSSVSLTFEKAEDPVKGSGLVFWAKDYNDYYVLVLTPAGSIEVQAMSASAGCNPLPGGKSITPGKVKTSKISCGW